MGDFDQPRAPARHLKTAGKRQSGRSGTALANTSSGLFPVTGTWGGARNSALRTSSHLTLKQCLELLEAADHATRLGLPFNRHWTVHYQKAGIAEADAMRFIGKLLKLLSDFASARNAQRAAIWAREGGPSKGGHVHILLHVPAALRLTGKTRRWVRLAGGTAKRGVSFIRSVAGNVSAAEGQSEHYWHNAEVVRCYLLKGADEMAGEALGLEVADQGIVIGKRCGTTQNIGKAARERWQ